jgi:hypothetical protein
MNLGLHGKVALVTNTLEACGGKEEIYATSKNSSFEGDHHNCRASTLDLAWRDSPFRRRGVYTGTCHSSLSNPK